MNPKVHIRIEAEGPILHRSLLSLSDGFSYEIIGADLALKNSLLNWLSHYSRATPLPFSTLPELLTPFQKKVLLQLSQIPFGKTLSYQELARRCEKPLGARAIGGVCKRNPLPLLIPCHRVIRTDGSLGGFSPDLEIKKRLLAFEQP